MLCLRFVTPWHVDNDITAAAHAAPRSSCRSNPTADSSSRRSQRLLDLARNCAKRIWAMIQTPLAILKGLSLAAEADDSESRLDAFRDGHQRPRQGHRARIVPGRAPVSPWLMQCIAAVRIYGVDIIDGVYNDLGNAEGSSRECRRGARHGLRRQDPHPSQPDRGLQRPPSRPARTTSPRRRRSSQHSICRRTRTRAWSRSTAA